MKPKSYVVIIAVFCALAANAHAADVLQAWPVDPLIKVFRDAAPEKRAAATAEVARGECASLQIVVRADQPIEGLRASISPLHRAWGPGVLTPRPPRYVGYVPVDRPTQKPSHDQLRPPPADYPDPLLEDASIAVAAGQAQPVWLTFPVPTNTPPGTYRGRLMLDGTVAGKRTRIEQPVAVVVRRALAGPARL